MATCDEARAQAAFAGHAVRAETTSPARRDVPAARSELPQHLAAGVLEATSRSPRERARDATQFRLRVEDLGALGVRIVLNGARVQVRVECTDATAVPVVEACRRELAHSLAQHDLSLAALEVGVQAEQGRGGATGHSQRELPDSILAAWPTVVPYPARKPHLRRGLRTAGLDALA